MVLKIKGLPAVTDTGIIQESDGAVRLMASEADLHGGLQYETGGGKDNIGYWINPADTAAWSFKLDRPGKFKLTAEIAAEAAGKFEVSVGEQKISGASLATKDFAKFKRINLKGQLELLQPGRVTLTVKPVADGWQPMNLRSLTLVPVK